MNALLNRLRGFPYLSTRDDEAGFSIVEVMVAMMVFAILAVCIAGSLTNGLVLTTSSKNREVAINLASQDIDSMRMNALGSPNGVFQVTSTSTPIVYTVGGNQFSLTRQVDWVTTTGGSGACGTGSGTLAYKSVVDTVSWLQNSTTTMSTSMTTLVAPISNINTDTDGTIIVAIIGASGAPETGVNITITPNSGGGGAALSTAPSPTDSDGCSFGLNVQPGTYTVTATESGGIDYLQNAPAKNASVVVTAGQNTMVNFTYDQAGKFPLTYPVGAVLPTNMPITFTNATGGQPQWTNSPTSINAFPYPDGYQVIAGSYVFSASGGPGSCLDSNPQNWPTNSSTGAQAPVPVIMTAAPGATATSSSGSNLVNMGQINVTGYTTGQYLTAVTTVGPSGSKDPGCGSVQTLTFPKTTAATTLLALPFGTWKIYSGSSSGALTTDLIKTKTTNVVGVTTATISSTTYTVMLDPRVVLP